MKRLLLILVLCAAIGRAQTITHIIYASGKIVPSVTTLAASPECTTTARDHHAVVAGPSGKKGSIDYSRFTQYWSRLKNRTGLRKKMTRRRPSKTLAITTAYPIPPAGRPELS